MGCCKKTSALLFNLPNILADISSGEYFLIPFESTTI